MLETNFSYLVKLPKKAMRNLLLLFICQMLFGCHGKAYSNISCTESERRALLDFRKGLIDNSNRLSSWTGENCCRWEGIGCNMHTGRVVKLDLRPPIVVDIERYYFDTENYRSYFDSFRLGGEIGPSLLRLEYLQHLDLSTNKFSGIQIPTFLGSFKYMGYLNLSATQFLGEIPTHLGNLSRLQYLDLGNNGWLSAKSLSWLVRLSSLKSLDLSYVGLGEAYDWLQAIHMLPSLQSLNLRNCNLRNPSTPSSANATSLVSLILYDNYMGSSFPLWLFNLSSLSKLYLRDCGFQGTLPNMFEKLTSLTVLDLSSNGFNNSIPNSICTLTSFTQIDLSGNFFQGEFPLCLENLTSLAMLRLGSNGFRGTIPFEIGHLGKLTELDLSHNKLEGTISSSLGQLSELQSLSISNNSFVGELTEFHFAKLSELKSLDISRTFLRINVSSQWFPPFQLLEIFLDCTPVGPKFPTWLETQKNVVKLRMSNASISDWIPIWFEVVYSHINYLDLSLNQISGKPPEIEGARYSTPKFLDLNENCVGVCRVIKLSFNKFRGSLSKIPRDVEFFIMSSNSLAGQLPSLDSNGTGFSIEVLSLNNNSFSGNIPSIICNIKSLQALDLSNNNLSGDIPFCLGNLQNLLVLNLANNSLCGQIPGSLGKLGRLSFLLLKENKFHGELPLSMRNLTSLITLDLGDNQLSGTLPRWFGKELTNLSWVSLQSNNFYGDIPPELCQLSYLQVLNLAKNNFTGVIPRCFWNFTPMALPWEIARARVKYLFNFSLPGSFYKSEILTAILKGRSIGYSLQFAAVKSISLSENKLVGEIPKELMDLAEVQSLNLSRNNLQGKIPENIGNMRKLESLDLSMNELSGFIPPSLATIDFLEYLNLSFNKLSGQIPQGNHFQTLDDKSIYEGNEGLCGKPLSNNCSDDKPSREDGPLELHPGESSDISWFYAGMGPGFAIGFTGVFSVLLFMKSWRYAYFKFVENHCSSMWIRIVVKISILRRKFKRVNA